MADIVAAVQDADLQRADLLGAEVALRVELGLAELEVVPVGEEVLVHLAAHDGVQVAVLIFGHPVARSGGRRRRRRRRMRLRLRQRHLSIVVPHDPVADGFVLFRRLVS